LIIVKNGVDLGWITITGEDASTNVASTVFDTPVVVAVMDWVDTVPLFAAVNNSVLPVIDQVFIGKVDVTYTTVGALVANNSKSFITAGSGFTQFYTGVLNLSGSVVTGTGAHLSGESESLVSADAISNFQYAVFGEDNNDNGAWTCVYARGGILNIFGASLTDSDYPLYGTDGAIIQACDVTISNAHNNSIVVDECFLSARGVIITGAGGGIIVRGGRVDFRNSELQVGASPASSDIQAVQGSVISAYNATGGTNITVNTITASGIIFR